MKNLFMKLCSLILVAVLLVQMLPVDAFAAEAAAETAVDTSETAAEVTVVGEDTSRRSQYIKEYKLSNGQRLASVHADALHYEKDGQ